MDKLIIIGAGGHGKVLADIAEKMDKYSEIAFLDDGGATSCMGYPVVGASSDASKYASEYEFIVAVGKTDVRRRITLGLEAIGAELATLVHPSASIGGSVVIGEGSAVMAGAVINPCTVIGRGCIINTSSSVDHDCTIGDYVHVAVGARVCGVVSIGDNTWVGAGAVISNGLSVCGDCMLGAGAVVVKSISAPGTYVGVPAKIK